MSATREAEVPRTGAAPAQREASRWRQLLVAAGSASVLAFVAIAILLRDAEAGAYAGGFVVGLAFLRLRRGWLGPVVLLLLSVNVLAWMSLGVISNLREAQGVLAVAIPAALTVLSSIAVAGAVAELARRVRPGGSLAAVRAVALAGVVVFVVLVAASALTRGDGTDLAEGELFVDSNNILFEPEELEAAAGEITVRMANQDLFWHTFTIDELDVDLFVAVGGERAVTFEAPAGTYPYYCRIPGHETRMQGTLVVHE